MPIPEGLAAILPGAELSGLLARIALPTISGSDTVEVLKARYRQLCHERAAFLEALLEVALREPFSDKSISRLETPDEFAPDEVRAALVWSRRRSDSTFELAWDVHWRLPMLGEAMLTGDLDEPRARAFVSWTRGLTNDQAAFICDLLLPRAPGWTVGELIDEIRRHAIAIDPEWAANRYKEAVRERRVVGMRNDDGSATVSGVNLPLDRAAAGCERIDRLAKACKRAGDRRRMDHIKSDLFMGFLDGAFEGMSDDQVVAHVLAHPFIDPEPNTDPDSSPPDNSPPDNSGPDGGDPGDASEAGAHECGESGSGEPEPGGNTSASVVGRSWAAAELRVKLTTLLGFDEHPAEVPGWDVIHADLARRMAASMHSAEWRFVVCGEDLRAIFAGITRRRPHPLGARPGHSARQETKRDARRGGVVELQITRTDLMHLADLIRSAPPDLLDESGQPDRDREPAMSGKPVLEIGANRLTRPGSVPGAATRTDLVDAAGRSNDLAVWARVIADLARQLSAYEHTHGKAAANNVSNDVSDSYAAGCLPAWADSGRDAEPRRAGAALRRWVQIRGRVCSGVGCRMPAMKTDQDHITDWILGGPTTDANLHPACRHHHRARHEGSWRVTTPAPGVIVWHSPLGHSYTVTPPPIITRLPDPRPRNWPHVPYTPDETDYNEPTMPSPPPTPEPSTSPGPEWTPVSDETDVCPF